MRCPLFSAVFAILLYQSGGERIDDDDDFSDDYEITETGTSSFAPRLLSLSTYTFATVGETISFPCEAEIPDNVDISWKINDKYVFGGNITNLGHDRFHIVNRTTLQISGVVPSDEGTIKCEIATEPPLELFHGLEVKSRPSDADRCAGKSEKWVDLGGDFCYLIEQEKAAHWIEAVYQCFQEGGSLATLQSIEEVKRLRRYLKNHQESFYIGLWKHNDGSFEWVDKSTAGFRNWDRGEPNEVNERCVEMFPGSGKWNDVQCDREKRYLCSALKSETTPAAGKVCPETSSDWSDYGSENCYIVELYNVTTSEGAAERCSTAGGSLAIFHSIEEISVVTQHTKHHHDRLHIGFRQNSDEMFQWMDRSPVDVDFWDSGEPNDNIGEKCAEMYPRTGLWNDIPCDKLVGHVCSTPKVYPGIVATESPPAAEAEICGDDITADSGTIQSPNYPENYSPNTNCFWKITVPEYSQIVLTFQQLQLEYGADCEFDYVEVLDGHEPDSTVLHKSCGSDSHRTVRSSGNKMAVKFSTDKVNQRSGFIAHFQKAEQCGGNIVAGEGTIESRNYPDNYWPNDVCIWRITIPEDNDVPETRFYGVLFKFKTFEIEDIATCEKDYIEILDGHDVTSNVLGRYCGSNIPNEIRSLGHKITVRFVSDESREYYGFSAEFKKIEVSQSDVGPEPLVPVYASCEDSINYERGTLVSPNFPEQYSDGVYCSWTIGAPRGSNINLRFKTFELERATRCEYDYVSVHDGPDTSSGSLGKFCGSSVPDIITSSGNQLTVLFKTDGSGRYPGFSAAFNTTEGKIIGPEEDIEEEACEERITSSDEGVIESPNYPENYAPNLKCTWKITVSTDHVIVLDFTAFEVETDVRCEYDYVLVRDGHSPGNRVLAKLCGHGIPTQISSSGNKLSIEFKSDSSDEYSGFRVQFKKHISLRPSVLPDLDTCGGDISSENGAIRSPNYPLPYGPLEQCIWKITVPENNLISFKFDSLQLERSRTCSFDDVTIFDGDNVNSPVLNRLCSDVYDTSLILSSGNKLTVKFKSDDTFELQGFSGVFNKVITCGEAVVADEGVIHSPNSTDGFGYNCIWNITVPETYTVVLKIRNDTQSGYNPRNSFSVMIRDGADGSGNVLMQHSSLQVEHITRSRTNGMHITVVSDGSEASPYFYAEFKKDKHGGDIVADSGTITSPNYPGRYYPLEDSTWRITVPEGYQVKLTCETFHLESSGSCRYDFLEIRDGHLPESSSLGKFCGTTMPDEVFSSENKMSLRFETDSSGEYNGFSCKFEKTKHDRESCGGNIIAESGVVSSPNYPENYPQSSTCTWKITVPEGNIVSLRFKEVELEANSDCTLDYVKLFDGHDESNSPMLGTFCRENPYAVQSTTNEMALKFVSDGSIQYKGFTAEFAKEPVSYTDVENVLRQFPGIIFEQSQKKQTVSRGKKKKPIKKRSLHQVLEGSSKLV